MNASETRTTRRRFLGRLAGAAAGGLARPLRRAAAADAGGTLRAGEGVTDVTPPLGIELAGFHRRPGNERRITGIRQKACARALVLQHGSVQAALVSLDSAAVSREMADRVRGRVAAEVGIPAEAVCVSATHSHSMPSFRFFRQWGAVSGDYMADVEGKIVAAVAAAREDLAPASLSVGKARAVGGNFNRTTKVCRTDAEFTDESTDDLRWVDHTLHALLFERAAGKKSLLWYQFSAHPVCFRDTLAGPDWPGLVHQTLVETKGLAPSFLQGHCGDVNPGDGTKWIGDAEPTAAAVSAALAEALGRTERVDVDRMVVARTEVPLPLDLALFKQQIDLYRAEPEKCSSGEYVDGPFAADWFASATRWDAEREKLAAPLTAVRLGPLAIVFHPSELYSFYGLAIRRDSPAGQTIPVGYTNGFVGYLPDPNAYKAGEYAAMVVPKICGLPPFEPTAGRTLAAGALGLLGKVAAS